MANRDSLLTLTESNHAAAVGLYIVSYAVVTGASLPAAVILTLACGFLLGSVLGTVYTNEIDPRRLNLFCSSLGIGGRSRYR